MAVIDMITTRIKTITTDLANIEILKTELQTELATLQAEKDDYTKLLVERMELYILKPRTISTSIEPI